MSRLKGKVGDFALEWSRAPAGATGEGDVIVDGRSERVRWWKDAQGITIELGHGLFAYDLSGEIDEADGRPRFRVRERNGDGVFENQAWRNETDLLTASSAPTKKRALKIKSQMPGKIVKVLVAVGDEVRKDQPVLVMEAMKMENEIRAVAGGKVEVVLVEVGQAVETGAELLRLASL